MKKFKYLYIGVLSAILSCTFTSCEDYLDVNKNPNYPDESQVTVTTLLPSAFTGSAAAMGYLYQLYGSMWSQHYTQNPSSSLISISSSRNRKRKVRGTIGWSEKS